LGNSGVEKLIWQARSGHEPRAVKHRVFAGEDPGAFQNPVAYASQLTWMVSAHEKIPAVEFDDRDLNEVLLVAMD